MAPTDQPRTEIPISWIGYDDVPVVYANQILLQYQPEGGFVIGIGQSTPPALVGSPESMQAQLDDIEFIPVRTLLRAALTEQKMRELIAVFQAGLDKADQFRQLIDPRGGEAV